MEGKNLAKTYAESVGNWLKSDPNLTKYTLFRVLQWEIQNNMSFHPELREPNLLDFIKSYGEHYNVELKGNELETVLTCYKILEKGHNKINNCSSELDKPDETENIMKSDLEDPIVKICMDSIKNQEGKSIVPTETEKIMSDVNLGLHSAFLELFNLGKSYEGAIPLIISTINNKYEKGSSLYNGAYNLARGLSGINKNQLPINDSFGESKRRLFYTIMVYKDLYLISIAEKYLFSESPYYKERYSTGLEMAKKYIEENYKELEEIG